MTDQDRVDWMDSVHAAALVEHYDRDYEDWAAVGVVTSLVEVDCPNPECQGGFVDDTACHDPGHCSFARCHDCNGMPIFIGVAPKTHRSENG